MASLDTDALRQKREKPGAPPNPPWRQFVGRVALSLALALPLSATVADPANAATTTVSVLGNQPWNDTGLDITTGSTVTIEATGLIHIAGSDPGKTPDGHPGCVPPPDATAPDLDCVALIARIGDNPAFLIGSSETFQASVTGRLYLGINDNVFDDNSGSWTATITVDINPARDKLFVLLQGLGSELTSSEAIMNNGNGRAGGFYNTINDVPGIVPFLQSHGYNNGARFLVYSYQGPKPGTRGNPNPYSCLQTFKTSLKDAVSALGSQINAALTNNPDTDIYLIGHSLGGMIALAYEAALLKTSGIVPSLPQDALLKGVVTLDSPLGGVVDNPDYKRFAEIYYQGTCVGLKKGDMNVLKELFTLYKPGFPRWIGIRSASCTSFRW